MAAAPKDADVRSVIRSILVSNPNEMTLQFLDRDFKEMEGYPIPYQKFGFKTLLDYVKSIPDTVTVKGSFSNPVVLPVATEKAAHVEKLVLKQRLATNRRMPARRTRNHVSAKASINRTRKSGTVSHMPQAKSVDAFTLPASSLEINNNDSKTNNPNKTRLKINLPFIKRHILSVERRNDSTHKRNVSSMHSPQSEARVDGSSLATNNDLRTHDPDNPFKNRSEIDPKCLQEQIDSFKMKHDYSSYKIDESISQTSRHESNGTRLEIDNPFPERRRKRRRARKRKDSTIKNSEPGMHPPQSEARVDDSSLATNNNDLKTQDPDNPFKNGSEIDPKCLHEQIDSFKKKHDYSFYKINESTSNESNGRKETAKQELGENQTQSTANNSLQNSAKKKKNNLYLIKKRQQAALRRLSNMMDDSSSFSLTVATRLRRLSQHQRHFAEILINRVLYHGASGLLSSATDLTNSYYYDQQFTSYYNSYY